MNQRKSHSVKRMDSHLQNSPPNETVQSSRWSRKSTQILTRLVGWIPLSIGITLRNFAYRNVFRQLGKSVKIQPDVNFADVGCLELGDQVTISRGSCINTQGESRVVLGNHVFLDRDVRISCSSGNAQAELQNNVSLDRGVDIKVHGQGRTLIGKRTYIGPYVCLSGYGNITIGNDCLIASHTSLYAHNYNFEDPTKAIREQGYSHKGIVIGNNCWLGSGVRVLDGVTIEAGSIIGAGAVVTKNIPPNSIAVGTPAKVIISRV